MSAAPDDLTSEMREKFRGTVEGGLAAISEQGYALVPAGAPAAAAEPHLIKVWAFRDAPSDLRDLSPHGGDEDWLAILPPSYEGGLPYWMESGGQFGCAGVSEHPQPDGSVVCIGAHA